MSRSVSLRRVCSHLVSQRIEEALRATVYIVHQAGPTGFVLKQGESKFKVTPCADNDNHSFDGIF